MALSKYHIHFLFMPSEGKSCGDGAALNRLHELMRSLLVGAVSIEMINFTQPTTYEFLF